MPNDSTQPTPLTTVIDMTKTYKPGCLRAMRSFRATKPWRGFNDERMQKLRQVATDLAAVYGVATPAIETGLVDTYDSERLTIVLRAPRLSVLSFLHAFARHKGDDETESCLWAANLFRRIFPVSFQRLIDNNYIIGGRQALSIDDDQDNEEEIDEDDEPNEIEREYDRAVPPSQTLPPTGPPEVSKRKRSSCVHLPLENEAKGEI